LSRLEGCAGQEPASKEIDDFFPEEHLYLVQNSSSDDVPWFADFANYLSGKVLPQGLTFQQRKKFFSDLRNYFWEDPYLFRICSDHIVRRCVSQEEGWDILTHCHSGPVGGHYASNRTAEKVLAAGFYWPTLFQDAHQYVLQCDRCQRAGNLSRRDEMPQHPMQFCEIFDVWGIDFM